MAHDRVPGDEPGIHRTREVKEDDSWEEFWAVVGFSVSENSVPSRTKVIYAHQVAAS